MLKIGEFSKLSHITVKALRFYEKQGLLVPASIDKWTGYRFYETSQLERAAKIKAYRQLDLSIDEIKAIFHGDVFFSFYGSIDSKSNLSIKKIFPILSVFILTLVPLLRVVNLLISTRKNSYKKAQYGVVNRKFSELKKKKKGGLKTYYYADVIFPSNNTIIRKVKCGVIVYNSIDNGSRVLVISFDDRVTHIVAA